jgi:hypothetical protein
MRMRKRTVEVELTVQESHSILMGYHMGDATLPDGTRIDVVAIGHNMQVTIDGDTQIMVDMRPVFGAAYELYKGDDLDHEKDIQYRAGRVGQTLANLLRAGATLHQVEQLVMDTIEEVEGKSYYCDIHA